MPEGTRLITTENVNYAIESLKSDRAEAIDYRGADLVADEDRAGALIELLGEVGNDASLIRAINHVLKEQQATIRLQREKE